MLQKISISNKWCS